MALPDPEDLRLFLGGSSVSAGGDITSVLFVLTSDSSAGNGSISTTYTTNLFYSWSLFFTMIPTWKNNNTGNIVCNTTFHGILNTCNFYPEILIWWKKVWFMVRYRWGQFHYKQDLSTNWYFIYHFKIMVHGIRPQATPILTVSLTFDSQPSWQVKGESHSLSEFKIWGFILSTSRSKTWNKCCLKQSNFISCPGASGKIEVVSNVSMCLNRLSPKIHIQILQTDLHTFLSRTVERIWFKIKAFSLWSSI